MTSLWVYIVDCVQRTHSEERRKVGCTDMPILSVDRRSKRGMENNEVRGKGGRRKDHAFIKNKETGDSYQIFVVNLIQGDQFGYGNVDRIIILNLFWGN
jgi:hypothetical protein